MGSDHRTTSLAVDGPRAAATDGEAKAIKSLLIRDIKDFDQSVPAVVRHDDGTIRPTYIGVWGQDRLIGAALIQPALCVAETLIYRTGTSGVHAAQIREAFAEHAAIIEGIAVVRKHRREGFGSQIKAFCDSWAADHGAELILSIPTNEGALGYDEGVWNDEGNRQRLLDMLKAHAAELRAWASDAGVRLPSAESAGELREQVRDLPQEPQIQEQPGYGYQPGFQQPQQWQQQPWN